MRGGLGLTALLFRGTPTGRPFYDWATHELHLLGQLVALPNDSGSVDWLEKNC